MKVDQLCAAFSIKMMAEDGSFKGYGSIFGNIDSQNEVVAKGAFTRSLNHYRGKNAMPAMLWQHDPTQPIGVWTDMKEDNEGLAVEGKLALGTQMGKEAYELMKMGALTGMSIGYRVKASRIDAANKTRVLTDVDLFEISLVTFPANDEARVETVKAADNIKTIREFEDFLRDEGFSVAAARAIAAGGFKARTEPRDEDGGLDDLATLIKRNIAIFQPTT